MDLRGLGVTFDATSAFESADRAVANELEIKRRQEQAEKDTKTAELFKQYGAGGMTMEDLGNAMMGVDAKMGMEIRRDVRVQRNQDHTKRVSAFNDIHTRAKGIGSEEEYSAFKEIVQ